MTPTRKRRLIAVLLILAGVSLAAAIASYSLQQNLLYFPSDLVNQPIPPGRQFRLGGLVKHGTVNRVEGGLTTQFVVTDGPEEVTVEYVGILPDLFREGQGVIARGALDDNGVFAASEVLAKHDENYMPPEVADALEQSGHLMTEGNDDS